MTTTELSTADISPFLITEERVEAFGNATKDYNKFHERYVYGSQITAWLREAADVLVSSSGYGFDCIRIKCRFKEPIENDSEIRLPEKIAAQIHDEKRPEKTTAEIHNNILTMEVPVFSGDKLAVEAALTYGFPERKELGKDPPEYEWYSYQLRESDLQDFGFAIGRFGDLLMLAFGLASPALQSYNKKNKILPAGMPIYLEQTVTFYNHNPLQAGERVSIGIGNVRKTKSVGSVDILLARKKEGKTRQVAAKARFFIGTAKPNEALGLEKAVLAQTF